MDPTTALYFLRTETAAFGMMGEIPRLYHCICKVCGRGHYYDLHAYGYRTFDEVPQHIFEYMCKKYGLERTYKKISQSSPSY